MAVLAVTCICSWNIFSYFWSTSHPNTHYQVSSQLAFRFRKKKFKIRFYDGGHATILDFRSERFELVLIIKSPWYFLSSFELIVFLMQENNFIIDFYDGCRCGHFWISSQNDLSYFDLQVTPILPTKFRVNQPIRSGVQNRFSRWRTWIFDQNEFSTVWCTSHPDTSYQTSSQFVHRCRRSNNLKQLPKPHNGRRPTDDRQWAITIAYLEHFVLMWAKKDVLRSLILLLIRNFAPLGWLGRKTSTQTKQTNKKKLPINDRQVGAIYGK